MARQSLAAPDRRLAGVASGDSGQSEFSAAGQASPWVILQGRFFMGAWSGSIAAVGGQVVLECSPDGGTTILNASLPGGADNLWNVPVALYPEAHPETDFSYRLRCAALTSGRIGWRLSQ